MSHSTSTKFTRYSFFVLRGRELKTKLITMTTAIMLTLVVVQTQTNVFASNEWNDSCYDAGYDDGQYGPFEPGTYDHCGDEGGDVSYYNGFIEGCMDANNARDVCEQATDAD